MIETHTKNKHTKFQSNIFAFACAMAKKKTGKGDEVTFLKCISLAFLIVVQKNRYFWNPEKYLLKIGIFLSENFEFLNLT